MNSKKKMMHGASYDAILLTIIKLVTTGISMVITRLLSEYLTLHDYGTYSQVLLMISLISSVTIFGMMDGVNYFYCREHDQKKREEYAATIIAMQCVVGLFTGFVVMLFSTPLCLYFDNPDIKNLLIFSAILPVLQNILGIIQVLIVSVGKARALAIRNFLISLIRLVTVVCVVSFINKIWVVFVTTTFLDIAQITFFVHVLCRHGCRIGINKFRHDLVGQIVKYCAPMAIFLMINSLNRDMDKYYISMMTDTETFALYSNASKQLPFDIVMSAFCTVLIPYITKYISENQSRKAAYLYKCFLEITYITTGILCCAAISAAPQLMKLLYSDKYFSGLLVFVVYILVDLFRFTNITLVLSAAGKTKILMILGMVTLGCNAVLNIILYHLCGIIGPAIATLIITFVMGIVMLIINARIMDTSIRHLFDIKYIAIFVLENMFLIMALTLLRQKFELLQMNYFFILVIIVAIYGCVMVGINGKRLVRLLSTVNHYTKNEI